MREYLYYITLGLQVATVVHLFKTGRSRGWLWLIIFFPLVGTLVYFIVEVIPGYRSASIKEVIENTLNSMKPGRELAVLNEKLGETGSVENRKALAEYYIRTKEPAKAVELYRDCLSGVFKDDDGLTLALAGAFFQAGIYAEARVELERLKKRSPAFKMSGRELLFARIHDALGETAEALKIIESLSKLEYGESEEARLRFGVLIEKLGDKERAKSIYNDIISRSKKFSRPYKNSQWEWIEGAKRNLKGLSGK